MNTAVLNTIVEDRMEIMLSDWMPRTAHQSSGVTSPVDARPALERLDRLTNDAEWRSRRQPPRMGTSADSMRPPESASRPSL